MSFCAVRFAAVVSHPLAIRLVASHVRSLREVGSELHSSGTWLVETRIGWLMEVRPSRCYFRTACYVSPPGTRRDGGGVTGVPTWKFFYAVVLPTAQPVNTGKATLPPESVADLTGARVPLEQALVDCMLCPRGSVPRPSPERHLGFELRGLPVRSKIKLGRIGVEDRAGGSPASNASPPHGTDLAKFMSLYGLVSDLSCGRRALDHGRAVLPAVTCCRSCVMNTEGTRSRDGRKERPHAPGTRTLVGSRPAIPAATTRPRGREWEFRRWPAGPQKAITDSPRAWAMCAIDVDGTLVPVGVDSHRRYGASPRPRDWDPVFAATFNKRQWRMTGINDQGFRFLEGHLLTGTTSWAQCGTPRSWQLKNAANWSSHILRPPRRLIS